MRCNAVLEGCFSPGSIRSPVKTRRTALHWYRTCGEPSIPSPFASTGKTSAVKPPIASAPVALVVELCKTSQALPTDWSWCTVTM